MKEIIVTTEGNFKEFKPQKIKYWTDENLAYHLNSLIEVSHSESDFLKKKISLEEEIFNSFLDMYSICLQKFSKFRARKIALYETYSDYNYVLREDE